MKQTIAMKIAYDLSILNPDGTTVYRVLTVNKEILRNFIALFDTPDSDVFLMMTDGKTFETREKIYEEIELTPHTPVKES